MLALRSFPSSRLSLLLLSIIVAACDCGDDPRRPMRPEDAGRPVVDGGFVCFAAESEACIGTSHYTCERVGEFLSPVEEDCADRDEICVPDLWCVVCHPGTAGCMGEDAIRCRDDGSGWDVIDECDTAVGLACRDGSCRNLCDVAVEERSYVGCEFYAADLDNAGIAEHRDASAQPFAVVVSNVSAVPAEVVVEINEAVFGAEAEIREIERVMVLPGDLEVFELPRREIDGSSSNQICLPDDRSCPASEVCVCSRMDLEPPCFCRVSADATGINDGTHTAVTSRAFRVHSTIPIIAYQFNPLDNLEVFSNDASLLLPTSAIGTYYTVVGWPQTIANHPTNPELDFDPEVDDEDLRATLTILGTADATHVDIVLGPRVLRVVGGGPIAQSGPGNSISLDIGRFDVINLETQGLNADFTGTTVESDKPVSVMVGSEASDAPRFDTYATRQCCADHLEEQLFPDASLGERFIIARMPPRTTTLNAAFVTEDSVGEFNEPEWVRIVAIRDGRTEITTTLPPPDDYLTLGRGESVILRADQDFIMDASQPIGVLQVMASQEAVGIPYWFPGGDPAIVAIPPTEQYRRDYVFLTPDKYAFDFVTITGPREATIMLDDAPLDPMVCTTSPADGIARRPGDPPPEEVIHRCQLSFPDVVGRENMQPALVEEGVQNDGVHTLRADVPIGVVIFGYDAYVSYAYAGGLNLDILN